MEDCKCGRIPPCYGSLEFAIYEEAKKVNDEWKKSRARHSKMIDKLRDKLMEGGFLDDTHWKVYGLNKQMCDIGRLISVKEMAERYNKQISQSRLDGLSAWLKLQDMEEKKTKKMTKAEAFGWLNGKKIRTEGNHEKVLRKLFDLGFVWKNLRDTRVDLGWQSGEVYGLTISDDEVAWWTTPHLFDTHGAEQVSADDILSIEIVEENRSEDELVEIVELGKKIQCLLPKLSGHRHVVITETDVLLYDEGMCLFHSDPF